MTAILDQIAPLTSDDPQTVGFMKEFMKEFVKELPWLPMFGTSKFVPVDTYYWTNFPSPDNYYEGPWWWWSLFKYMTPHFEPTDGNRPIGSTIVVSLPVKGLNKRPSRAVPDGHPPLVFR